MAHDSGVWESMITPASGEGLYAALSHGRRARKGQKRESKKGPMYSIMTTSLNKSIDPFMKAESSGPDCPSVGSASQSYWRLSFQHMLYGGCIQTIARGGVVSSGYVHFTYLAFVFRSILLEIHLFHQSHLFQSTRCLTLLGC